MVKLPQIQKIVAAKSGQGISFLSTLMELVVYTATFAYCYAKEFPFSSYGDSIFVMFQTLRISNRGIQWQGFETSQIWSLHTN